MDARHFGLGRNRPELCLAHRHSAHVTQPRSPYSCTSRAHSHYSAHQPPFSERPLPHAPHRPPNPQFPTRPRNPSILFLLRLPARAGPGEPLSPAAPPWPLWRTPRGSWTAPSSTTSRSLSSPPHPRGDSTGPRRRCLRIP
jgi:hypothetical protein